MSDIAKAIEILRAGGLVAFPTETVYGLGADATNPSGVQRIFEAKGRPSTNPLIVHVADEATARGYAATWPPSAARLAQKFWPGPLTLVVMKGRAIVSATTAGRDTVGLRAPDHPLALELLRGFDGAVAAPSANRSMRISPTTAAHVREELGGRVDLILDGGPCRVGIESTVLDLSGMTPTILRPGTITQAQIEVEIGPVALFERSVDANEAARSPGQQRVHYAPRTPTFRFDRSDSEEVARWLHTNMKETAAGIFVEDVPHAMRKISFGHISTLPRAPESYGRRLYGALREADQSGAQRLLVEMPPDAPAWAAVRDRLIRASVPWKA